ncbi:MAG TPA: hypothetical protein VF783_17650 [Terriglobales bacterium]
MIEGNDAALVNLLASDDPGHLARIIGDCIRAAEKYRVAEGPLLPEAYYALGLASLAAEKLNDRLFRLRAELDAVVVQ